MADLLALARAEQERAKTLLRRRLWCHGATLAFGLISLALPEPLVYAASVLALASESLAWYLKYVAGEAHQRAEDGRRRVLLARELGSEPDPLARASLLAAFSKHARRDAARWDDPDYYAAAGRPGLQRLSESLQESAFWSARLYCLAGRAESLRLTGIVAVIVFAVFVLNVIDAGSAAAVAARAATVALATLIVVDELGVALSWYAAAAASSKVSDRLEQVDSGDLGQMLTVFADYAVATATAPPIPTKIYISHHDVIDEAWKARSS